jgi:hypothetical protein
MRRRDRIGDWAIVRTHLLGVLQLGLTALPAAAPPGACPMRVPSGWPPAACCRAWASGAVRGQSLHFCDQTLHAGLDRLAGRRLGQQAVVVEDANARQDGAWIGRCLGLRRGGAAAVTREESADCEQFIVNL